MFGVTSRQRVMVAGAGGVSAAAAVMALAGWDRGALAGLALLTGMALVLLLDVRRRLGEMSHHMRRNARQQAKGTAVQKRLIAHERRVLAAVETARLDDLDGFEATRVSLEEMSRELRALRAEERAR